MTSNLIVLFSIVSIGGFFSQIYIFFTTNNVSLALGKLFSVFVLRLY